jgi:long-subunit acyl-CoA synthetase (AMP-forming)
MHCNAIAFAITIPIKNTNFESLSMAFSTQIVDALHGGETVAYTYAEMRDRVQKLTGTMQSLGVGPGDCVSVFAENSNRWLTTEQGIMRAGACNAVRIIATHI